MDEQREKPVGAGEGSYNEYPHYMFSWRNTKNMYTFWLKKKKAPHPYL